MGEDGENIGVHQKLRVLLKICESKKKKFLLATI
jgi:hypothetical protein